jgi:uncharacterized protein YPO0396
MSEHKALEKIEHGVNRLIEFVHRDTNHLEKIDHELQKLIEKVHHMTIEIDSLKAQVATTISLETQAIALLQAGGGGGGGLPAADLATVVQLTSQLKTSSDALSAVVGGGGGTGGTGVESTDIQNLLTAAQHASTVPSDPVQVGEFVTQMQASAASLSGAFTRNTPPLSATITQQEVAALASISALLSNLSATVNDPNSVSTLTAQIQSQGQALSAIIAANPRGATPPPVVRRPAVR